MSKSEWGKKHSCASCGALFYDMKKNPAHCPACGEKVDPQPLLKPRRTPATKVATNPEAVSEELNNADLPDEIEDVDIDNEDVELNDDDVDISAEDDENLIVDEGMDDDGLPEVAEHIETDIAKD